MDVTAGTEYFSAIFKLQDSIVILNLWIESWGTGRWGNLPEVRRTSCDTNVQKVLCLWVMPLLFTNFISSKKFCYNHGIQLDFWRSFCILCILCCSVYFAVHCFCVFSHNLWNILHLRLLFSLNPGYSPGYSASCIIPHLFPRTKSRTASGKAVSAFCKNRGRTQSYALPFRNKHPSLAILICCVSQCQYTWNPPWPVV